MGARAPDPEGSGVADEDDSDWEKLKLFTEGARIKTLEFLAQERGLSLSDLPPIVLSIKDRQRCATCSCPRILHLETLGCAGPGEQGPTKRCGCMTFTERKD